ncbi:MAG: hypothetical protein Q9187_003234 [Circinaria calcarea]
MQARTLAQLSSSGSIKQGRLHRLVRNRSHCPDAPPSSRIHIESFGTGDLTDYHANTSAQPGEDFHLELCPTFSGQTLVAKNESISEEPLRLLKFWSVHDASSIIQLSQDHRTKAKGNHESKATILEVGNDEILPPIDGRNATHSNDDYGSWLLHLAFQQERIDLLEMAFENCIPVSTEWLQQRLVVACRDGSKPLIQFLLARGTKVQDPAILGALLKHHLSHLLTKVFDPANVVHTEWRRQQLLNACQNGLVREAVSMLDLGEDVEARAAASTYLMKGRTALHTAARYGHIEIARLLLERGAWINSVYTGLRHPLHEAASGGHALMANFLLQNGASVDAQDESRYRPLHTACMAGSCDVARVLLDAGAQIGSCGNDKFQPIHHAAQDTDNADLIRLLVSYGANVETKHSFRHTPLIMACRSKHSSAIQALLDAGANPNHRGEKSPLQIACQLSHLGIARSLLKAGANPNCDEGVGIGTEIMTPLAIATSYLDVGIMKELLSQGANVDGCNGNGFAAVHIIALGNHAQVLKEDLYMETALEVLKEYKADFQAEDSQGRQVSHYLAERARSAVEEGACIQQLAPQLRFYSAIGQSSALEEWRGGT